MKQIKAFDVLEYTSIWFEGKNVDKFSTKKIK